MIHVMTVHWQTEYWIDIQLKYLKRYTPGVFRTYTILGGGIDPSSHTGKFDLVVDSSSGDHATNLTLLAQVACKYADPDDSLIFIDSDAFPVASLARIESDLKRYPLIAIRRDENAGDRQPHPSFCVTTAGFWSYIGADWSDKPGWINGVGETVCDVGGNLLAALEARSVKWKPLLRSNRTNLHPVLFGIYDDLVYHHAAGSRAPITREDLRIIRRASARDPDAEASFAEETVRRNQMLSSEIIAEIKADRDFLCRFGHTMGSSVRTRGFFHFLRQLWSRF